ncbi:ATP-dependent DNA helicase Rep [Abditibacteriota bacterium]|nr:ATP-dependent DNA helicase Rep [Abditibacteriota bacterium]
MTAPAYAPTMQQQPHLALVPAAKAIVGTPQQEAFWDAILTGKTHIVLSARAGSGKSFSIIHGARLALDKWPNLRVGFCAFNKAIADELKEKIPSKAEADTMHGFGFRAITEHLGGRTPAVKREKTDILLFDFLRPDELTARKRIPRPLLSAVSELVSKCKNYLLEGTPADIAFICARHDVELEPNRAAKQGKGFLTEAERQADITFKARVTELVPKVLEHSKEMLSTVDFDDMIWLVVELELPVPQFHILFVDESQDLNEARKKLAFMMLHQHGRLVVVGDPKQAIYGFTGADAHSMANMRAQMDTTSRGSVELPLTWTRRCPKAVVNLAQELVPDLEAMPDSPEGIVEHVSAKDAPTLMQPTDMVLCRCNAPLVKIAHQLLRMEKKALLKGKDLSKPIIELMDVLGATDVKEMGELLKRYRAVEVERLTDANKSAQVITAFEDKCETLEVLMEGCSARFQIEAKIKRIFEEKDPAGAVILTSVHSSKGLEADTIWLASPNLMPHPAALKKGRAEDIEQEHNLKYVALTRSMRRLIFIDETEASKVAPISPKQAFLPIETKTTEVQAPVLCAPVVMPEPIETTIKTGDWDAIKAHLQAACDAAPYDTDLKFFQGLEMAMGAIPRGS